MSTPKLVAVVIIMTVLGYGSTGMLENLVRRAADSREAAFLPPDERAAFRKRLSRDRRQRKLRVNPAMMCPSCGISGRMQARRVRRPWRRGLASNALRALVTEARCGNCEATWRL